MESQKLELIQKMESKNMSYDDTAQAMGFDPGLLKLYLIKDSYPVPKRILDKMAEVVSK